MDFERASGVLCNISSLPSEFGIGVFSKECEDFSKQIASMGFHWWQVLPISSIGWGNSPYSGDSSYAGNSLYINPEKLKELGLVDQSEVNEAKYFGDECVANYDFARQSKTRLLQIAFQRITPEIQQEIDAFSNNESDWLDDYAMFKALSEKFGDCWWLWEDGLARHQADAIANASKQFEERINFYKFEQFEFYREWFELKDKVNENGVGIIGDIPFYVGLNSVDVWANRELFQLNDDLTQSFVAGVPPDAFAKNGQIWGNPLYDFEKMRQNKFVWWRKRVAFCLRVYDALRLDHFRAFYNYFAIPAEDKETAKNGHWENGPQMEIINLFRQDNPFSKIIAEDLGDIDEDVVEFVKESGFMGMKIFQFGFDGTPSSHLPHNFEKNSVAYTGTHDNDTTLGWLSKLNDGARNFVFKYCSVDGQDWWIGGKDCKSVKAIAKTVIASSSKLAILPIQDLLGYGTDARMNVPGIASGNWAFRVGKNALKQIDELFFSDINGTYGRKTKPFRKI